MNNLLVSKVGSISIALSVWTSVSHASEIPTHCKSDEHVVLTAKLFREVGGQLGDDTGKILSLCADRSEEPLGKLIYRFGAIEKVEMERVATTSQKFGLSQQSDAGAHAGERSISFRQGRYVYQVSEALGMAAFGVRLYVYESNNPILTLLSAGYHEGSMMSIDFDKASSPIFKIVKPINPW
jgi:hypothetical protein